jgi:hypothetical protein
MNQLITYLFCGSNLFILGCKGQLESAKQYTGISDSILVSITDFTNGSGLYEKDSVFVVRSKELSNYPDLFVVTIGRATSKLLMTKADKVGQVGKLPTRYFEKDRKLFYWWDETTPLTQGALDLYMKYNMLQFEEEGKISSPETIFNKNKEGAHYYFCKNNRAKFKRKITDKGIGYYKPPKLNCSGN